MRETELVKQCLELLKLRGIFAWRQNTGAMRIGNRLVRFGQRGIADILGVLPDGRFLAIECKVGNRKVTTEQNAFLDSVEANGGVALVVRSLDELDRDLGEVEA